MFSSLYSRAIAIYHSVKIQKKFLISFCLTFFVLLGGFLVFNSQGANAEGSEVNFDSSIIVNAFSWILLAVAQLFLKLSNFILTFIIQIAAYNGFLDSKAVNIGWVLVRDITNMFFVVILLLVAFGTILGLEQYEWKKMMVKFFFAAILVNFSRIICGVIIDVGQVVMITFVNGIAATANGNLITAFNMTDINSIKEAAPDNITSPPALFGNVVGALVFSSLLLGIMISYIFILLSRMIVLWILIVLSPFAFVLSVIPQTQKFASQWWSEFGNHVVVGPAIVFFLWLSFAVVGNGDINAEVAASSATSKTTADGGSAGETMGLQYNSMANFAIALGILIVGAKTAQSLGTVGGSAMSKATDFGKKVAMIGSGAAAGLWALNKAKEVPKAIGKTLYNVTPASDYVERVQNFAKAQLKSWEAYRSEGPRLARRQAKGKNGELLFNTDGSAKMENVPKTEKKMVEKKGEDGKVIYQKDENGIEKIDEHGHKVAEMEEKEVELDGQFEFEAVDSRSWFQKTRYASREKIIKSRKKLKKNEDLVKTQEELIDKRITAVPDGWFTANMPDGYDRVLQGMLAAEKERSESKTKEFQEYGRQGVLAHDRFKDGKWQTGKGTVAEQVIAHKERAERNQERTKQLMSEEMEKYRKDKGKSVVAAKIEAKFKAEVADKAAHLAEGAAKLHFMEGRGGKDLERLTKIQAEEKEEHALVESVEKRAASKFALSHDGAHMLEVQKKAELQSKVFSGQIDEAESNADMKIKDSAKGRSLVSELNASDQAKKAAEDFIKILKDEDLKKQFEEAGKAIEEAVKKGPDALKRLAKDDVYVRAMQMSKTASHESEVLGIVQKEAESLAETEYVDKNVRGYGTPSSALVSVAKKYGDDLNSLNNAALAKALMDNLAFVAATDGTADISKRAALFGTVSKVNTEAYIDDTLGAMAAEMNRLFDAKDVASMSAEEKSKIEKMREVFVGQLGMFREKKDENGKVTGYAGISNAKNSSILQNYAITGGRVDMLQNHAKIEAAMAADPNLSYSDAAQQALGSPEAASQFIGEMRKFDTFFKEATSSFKNGALAAGHLQLGGHQMFDEKLGFHRMATAQEAAAIMESEVRKRGSKANYQFHSVGDLDTSRNVLERVNVRDYDNTIGKVTSVAEAAKIQDRTVDALMGYKPSEKQKTTDGYGELGGSEADIIAKFGSMQNFVRDVVAPQLASDPRAFALVAQRKFGNVNKLDAENGAIKVKIGNLQADSMQKLISQVNLMLGEESKELKSMLATSLAQAKELEDQARQRRGRTSTRAEAEAAEEEST